VDMAGTVSLGGQTRIQRMIEVGEDVVVWTMPII
jgi:hypothetical protein